MSDTNTKEIMDYMREIKRDLVKRIDELDEKIENGYVTKDAFEPVQKLVYGLVGAVMLAFITALLGLIIISNA